MQDHYTSRTGNIWGPPCVALWRQPATAAFALEAECEGTGELGMLNV